MNLPKLLKKKAVEEIKRGRSEVELLFNKLEKEEIATIEIVLGRTGNYLFKKVTKNCSSEKVKYILLLNCNEIREISFIDSFLIKLSNNKSHYFASKKENCDFNPETLYIVKGLRRDPEMSYIIEKGRRDTTRRIYFLHIPEAARVTIVRSISCNKNVKIFNKKLKKEKKLFLTIMSTETLERLFWENANYLFTDPADWE